MLVVLLTVGLQKTSTYGLSDLLWLKLILGRCDVDAVTLTNGAPKNTASARF